MAPLIISSAIAGKATYAFIIATLLCVTFHLLHCCCCCCLNENPFTLAMGAAGAKPTRSGSSGVAAIDEKLNHLRLHVADTMVTHGLIQEITVLINKNSNCERERFCQLLYSVCAGSSSTSAMDVSGSEGGSVNATSAQHLLSQQIQQQPTAVESSSSAQQQQQLPFAELFAKVRLMTDAASRTSVVHWLRHVTDSNEAEWTNILVDNQVVSFVTDFYQFQANTHVPPDTLTNMAHLLARWSSVGDAFAKVMNDVDAFRGVVVRLKFAQTSSKERSYLLSAMRRCYRNSLSRNDSFEILMKIAMERDENVEQTHVDCLEMIADALQQRNELLANITQKHINALQRFLTSSNALVASVMRLFVTVIEVEETLTAQARQKEEEQSGAATKVSPPSTPASPQAVQVIPAAAGGGAKSFSQELIKALCGVFDISLIDNPFAVPFYLVATCSLVITHLGSETAIRFVNEKWFAMLVRKVYKTTIAEARLNNLPQRFAQLLLQADPMSQAPKIAATSAMHLMLDCITVVTDEESMETVVQAAAELALADPNVGAALCADRKLHMLMQTLSSNNNSMTPEETLVVVWGMVRLLESVLTPQVLGTADEMLVMTVYSLLCQIMGSCTVPPKRFFITRAASVVGAAGKSSGNEQRSSGVTIIAPPSAVSAATAPPLQRVMSMKNTQPTVVEKILRSTLQMLLHRCNKGPSYAESILGQVPLGIVRALISADHLPLLRELAQNLAQIMASSSVAAMAELSILGCVPDRLAAAAGDRRNNKITLKRFQRHWKRVLHVRKISDNRVRMANLLKETFMCRLNDAHDETISFQSILDEWYGNLAKIHRDYEERDQLMDQHERQTEVLRRTEANARLTILMQMCEDAESKHRFKIRVEEQQIRVNVAPQRALAGKECLGRCDIAGESFGIVESMLTVHKKKFSELLTRLTKRTALLDAEVMARASAEQTYTSDYFKLLLYQRVMHISEDERIERTTLATSLLTQHMAFLKESFVILIKQTKGDEETARASISFSREREHHWLSAFYEQTVHMQTESYHRLEWLRIEHQTYVRMLTLFLTFLRKQIDLDESRVRAELIRTCVLDWRVCCLPYERFNVQALEDVKRKALINDHRIGMGMIAEASRFMKPIVCQAEELRLRQEIDLSYAHFCQENKWLLAFYQLVREEHAARNAVALQYFHIARNQLVPLMCIRLVDYQHRLMLTDLTVRTDIWVEERDEFYLILLAEVRDMQRLFRTVIAADQAQDHERLAQHFVTVTHVVRLQEQAQNALVDYAAEQRALEQNSGFKKSAPKKKQSSFVDRVKAMSAMF
ncbi:Hypothetical protein, putative [Bodo saltans]|uniref:Uncharacterized protein n=1 Tax=Bodo saltans TaxID=75058 RepID=A0A0S4IZA8_BODSA|nr:Hypothetical protein, putative [Bodo saltans]|eukprot:CUG29434.1 Hypothetical protein, putative [Bodo saltans]